MGAHMKWAPSKVKIKEISKALDLGAKCAQRWS